MELRKLLKSYEQTRDGRELYAGLCDMLRTYIEGEFSIRAPEQTTEEFLLELSRSDDIEEDYKTILKKFVSTGDLVKFACYLPLEEEVARAAEICWSFIRATGKSSERFMQKRDEGT